MMMAVVQTRPMMMAVVPFLFCVSVQSLRATVLGNNDHIVETINEVLHQGNIDLASHQRIGDAYNNLVTAWCAIETAMDERSAQRIRVEEAKTDVQSAEQDLDDEIAALQAAQDEADNEAATIQGINQNILILEAQMSDFEKAMRDGRNQANIEEDWDEADIEDQVDDQEDLNGLLLEVSDAQLDLNGAKQELNKALQDLSDSRHDVAESYEVLVHARGAERQIREETRAMMSSIDGARRVHKEVLRTIRSIMGECATTRLHRNAPVLGNELSEARTAGAVQRQEKTDDRLNDLEEAEQLFEDEETTLEIYEEDILEAQETQIENLEDRAKDLHRAIR